MLNARITVKHQAQKPLNRSKLQLLDFCHNKKKKKPENNWANQLGLDMFTVMMKSMSSQVSEEVLK